MLPLLGPYMLPLPGPYIPGPSLQYMEDNDDWVSSALGFGLGGPGSITGSYHLSLCTFSHHWIQIATLNK